MAERIDGKAIAAGVIETVKTATAELKRASGVVPGLSDEALFDVLAPVDPPDAPRGQKRPLEA